MVGEVPVRRTILRRQARPNGNVQPATLPFTNTPFQPTRLYYCTNFQKNILLQFYLICSENDCETKRGDMKVYLKFNT